jgi:3-hydroxyisobutyrate dehydrogenase-like beta-hydroxyacid dehydrogenase
VARAERIGFLGLGIMGSRMAANVARAGYELNVWTHTEGKAVAWAQEHGARAHETPAEVGATSDIVISMVVDGEQVASILLAAGGVIESARAGLLCVDMSTIAPTDARRIAAALAAREVRMLDSPVTGSSPRAQAGTLTIMVGGEREDYERALDVLQRMGSLIVRVGALGQGQAVKLVNNALAAANATALAEALVLGAAAGLDLDALLTVLAAGSGASTQLEMKAPAMRAHDYTTLFKTDHMLKDVRLCLEEAQAAGVPFPSAGHARDVLSATAGRGLGDQDYAAIIEAIEGFAGRRL